MKIFLRHSLVSIKSRLKTIFRFGISSSACILLTSQAFNLHAADSGETSQQTEDKSLVLHLRFDSDPGKVAKDFSRYKNDGTIIDGEWLADAGEGQGALRMNGSTAYINVPNYPSLWFDGDATFEMWIRQHAKQETGAALIFGETQPKTSYLFVLNQDYNLTFNALRQQEDQPPQGIPLPVPRKFLGEDWAHLAIVVEYPRCRFYKNGKLVWDQFMPLEGINKLEKRELRIGGNPTTKQFAPIDLREFRVYRRALDENEVASHASGEKTHKENPAKLFIEPNWYKDSMAVRYQFKGKSPSESVKISLRDAHGGMREKIEKLKDVSRNDSGRYEAIAEFSLNELEDETVNVSAHSENEKAMSVTQNFDLVKPQWIKAKAGITKKIPPPWKAIEVKNEDGNIKLDVLLRQYAFDKSVFPTQVLAKDENLLAGPIQLKGDIAGKEVQWNVGPVEIAKQEDRQIVLRQILKSDDLALDIQNTFEYDGFTVFEVKLKALKQVTLENLRLSISLHTRHAELCYGDKVYPREGNDYTTTFQSGVIPRDLNFMFSPNIWLGDNDRGLTWQAESDEFWRNADKQKAIQILPKEGITEFRANFVDKATVLEPGQILTYKFALLATPVKPLAQDAWDIRIARYEPIGTEFELPARYVDGKPEVQAIADLGVRHLYSFISDIFAWPTPIHEAYSDALHRLVKSVHSAGVKIYPYVIHQRFPINVEEFDVYGGDMAKHPLSQYTQPLNNWPVNWKRPGTPAVNYGADSSASIFMCPKSEPLQDAYMYSLYKRLRDYDEDGVYLDGTGHIVACENESHGCGYKGEDGKRHYTYPVFAVRDLMRRIYTIVKTAKPDGLIDVHCSFGYNTAALAYADIIWNGEQWHNLRHTGTDYIAGELPLDKFRTEFMGRQLGVAAETLHYRLRNPMKIAATSLLHDISPRYSLGGYDNSTHSQGVYMTLIPKMWKMRDEFGAKEAEKLFYWNNQDYVKVTPDQCYVTLLKHPRNGTLALVSNLSRESRDVQVDFQLEKLGLKSGQVQVINALTGEAIKISDSGQVSLPLESEQWVYLWMKPLQERTAQ